MPCTANEDLPRLILIGDSTVKCGHANGIDQLWGWGQVLAEKFDTTRIKIENHARGGRSSRTFLTEGLWEKALERVRPGDFVLMQFGHNDGGEMFKGNRPRASIKGNGEGTVEGTVEISEKHEVVHSYGWYLRKYVTDTQAKGAIPITLSLTPRNRWKNGRIIRSADDYAKWAKQAAEQKDASFIDLNELVAAKYEQTGKEKVQDIFFTNDDWTHTTLDGAKVISNCVVKGIRDLSECTLVDYLKPALYKKPSLPNDLQFVFGASDVDENTINVTEQDVYEKSKGYGFEPGATVSCGNRIASADKEQVGCRGNMPYHFSVALKEGNYRVKVVGGDTPLTVKAELRRLMCWQNASPQSSPSTAEFTVNVRTARINDRRSVHLKQREWEKEYWAWDEKLTLELNGSLPCLHKLSITPEPDAITVFLAGDSTVTDQPNAPWASWGQILPYFFRPGIAVANLAQSGESVASSLAAGRFEKIFSQMKSGDHLLIQFGHNDMKSKSPDALSDYSNNLIRVVKRTRELGGIPVLLTSMERKPGSGYVSLGKYPQAVRDIAQEHSVPLIDLNAMSHNLYKALGSDVDLAFQDGTHHTVYGSYLLAKCVVQGIVDNRLSLAPYLNCQFNDFDVTQPETLESVTIPASPFVSLRKPEGS